MSDKLIEHDVIAWFDMYNMIWVSQWLLRLCVLCLTSFVIATSLCFVFDVILRHLWLLRLCVVCLTSFDVICYQRHEKRLIMLDFIDMLSCPSLFLLYCWLMLCIHICQHIIKWSDVIMGWNKSRLVWFSLVNAARLFVIKRRKIWTPLCAETMGNRMTYTK